MFSALDFALNTSPEGVGIALLLKGFAATAAAAINIANNPGRFLNAVVSPFPLSYGRHLFSFPMKEGPTDRWPGAIQDQVEGMFSSSSAITPAAESDRR